ncbi:MAG: type II 3-dehydroquinate dehydratase [Pseudolabrys sp.]|nr:type II 3-dehydroquinate dehydratase [Pseudolabrys sp.]MBV9955126.1 type II 3-dehydroquinate dehydratase [Pseudolabrys sp.]
MAKSKAAKTIYVLNGPNLNLLGTREPEKYGTATLADVKKICAAAAKKRGHGIVFRQSNHEGDLVDWIQEAKRKKAAGIVINPAGYTTTSIAILDALLAVKLPTYEIHITDIHKREAFRHNSYIAMAATGSVVGHGVEGYAMAVDKVIAAAEKR